MHNRFSSTASQTICLYIRQHYCINNQLYHMDLMRSVNHIYLQWVCSQCILSWKNSKQKKSGCTELTLLILAHIFAICVGLEEVHKTTPTPSARLLLKCCWSVYFTLTDVGSSSAELPVLPTAGDSARQRLSDDKVWINLFWPWPAPFTSGPCAFIVFFFFLKKNALRYECLGVIQAQPDFFVDNCGVASWLLSVLLIGRALM